MRLYRGLKKPYRPELVGASGPFPPSTDFTDCPFTALEYASTPRGVVLVLEGPEEAERRVSEGLWGNRRARRLIVLGSFDHFIVRIVPAKELRTELRMKGVPRSNHPYGAWSLEKYIDDLVKNDRAGEAPAPTAAGGEGHSPRTSRSARRPRGPRGRLSTLTITGDGQIVPWLAAAGPLAYSPEEPPKDDYYFQYGWVLPGVFAAGTNLRRHHYFGACWKEQSRDLFSFWRDARSGRVWRVAGCLGNITEDTVTAPIAVYGPLPGLRGPELLFMQHGSYQLVPAVDQPLLEAGEVMLYRGLQETTEVRLFRPGPLDPAERKEWRRYLGVQAHVLIDATRSFNSIHDRTARSETGHIRDRSWMSDAIARERGLDIEASAFARALWQSAHQSFSLARWVAQRKFGPNYVVSKTPLGNIRLTTFFAGEHEVRVIDPGRVALLEAHGCRAEWVVASSPTAPAI
ncbi:MAG TPA: hypothetical protein VJA16_00700 [Thermoanaerobaculia bacterium]